MLKEIESVTQYVQRKKFPRSHILVPLAFWSAIAFFIPIADAFELHGDEGLNLIKALLVSQGFSLYEEIWSDQPPVLTLLLSWWFHLFGTSVLAARIFIILFATLLVWSFYHIVRRYLGHLPAIFGTSVLVLSYKFLKYSSSVMIGIPSLALTTAAIFGLIVYKEEKKHLSFLALPGILFALSLQTKLYTVFLFPILFLYTISSFTISRKEFSKQNAIASFLWGGIVILVYLFIGIATHSLNYEQIVSAHFNSNLQESARVSQNTLAYIMFQDPQIFVRDFDGFLLAAFGTFVIAIYRLKSGIFPLVWLAAAIFVLSNHIPVWDHHYHLFLIPLAWLAAYSLVPLLDVFPHKINQIFTIKNWKTSILLAGSVLLLIGFGLRLDAKYYAIRVPGVSHTYNAQLFQNIQAYKKQTNWIFVDRPIYAFRANLSIPPELALISYKRIKSGKINQEQIFSWLQKYEPEQIALLRFRDNFDIYKSPEIQNYLANNYIKTENENWSWYLHKKIKN
jgi:4-amino-4-deoxy-L-arabinose transferase-like glycosyltransferase